MNTAQGINFFYYIQRPAQTQLCVTVSIVPSDVYVRDDYVVKLIQKLYIYIYFYYNNKNLINNQYKIHQ